MDLPITDPDDDRLADFARLSDPSFRMADEARRGHCVVESPQAVRVVLGAVAPATVRSVLVTPDLRAALADVLDEVAAPVFVADPPLLRQVVGFDLHRGALASLTRPEPAPIDAALIEARTVVVTESVNDHENLGALFRSSAALGADAILLDPTTADPLYRRCIRVAIGHVFTVPWARTAPLPGGLDDLRARGFTVAALTPDPAAPTIAALAAARPEQVALLVGAEGPGLRASTRGAADVEVRIPMRSGVDSLNVATAAAIALHTLTPTPG